MHVASLFAMLNTLTPATHQLILAIVSAVFQWLFGALWYGVIFKKSWTKLVGFAAGEKPKSPLFAWAASFVACFVLSFVLVHLVSWAGSSDFSGGSTIAIICWLGFMAPPLFTQHIFENRRANLFAINACYWLLAMALGGGIMGAFHS